jgi:hypothetical protein
MKSNNTIFETGATSDAVNNLILFTDTTRELAAARDIIYNQLAIAAVAPKWFHFKTLLTLATNQYIHENPGTHWDTSIMSVTQKKEFCQLYSNGLEEWKSEQSRHKPL